MKEEKKLVDVERQVKSTKAAIDTVLGKNRDYVYILCVFATIFYGLGANIFGMICVALILVLPIRMFIDKISTAISSLLDRKKTDKPEAVSVEEVVENKEEE